MRGGWQGKERTRRGGGKTLSYHVAGRRICVVGCYCCLLSSLVLQFVVSHHALTNSWLTPIHVGKVRDLRSCTFSLRAGEFIKVVWVPPPHPVLGSVIFLYCRIMGHGS